MFNFLSMADNYEERKVAHDDFDWGMIDTCYVNDGDKDYETAVEHKKYNAGKMVIVEAYDTKDEAIAGHKKWVQIMTAKVLPKKLKDCANSYISQFIGEEEFEFED